MGKELLAVRIT